MSDLPKLAERLKAEGNALFVKKDYKRAHLKYSEAIKVDDNNAILYANRAACSQFLRKSVELLNMLNLTF